EDEPEAEYFELLEQAFSALDDASIGPELIRVWFLARMLTLAGHRPNLSTDTAGNALDATKRYNFSFEDVSFAQHPQGRFDSNRIKLLRLLFSPNVPKSLQNIEGISSIVKDCAPLVNTMAQTYIRL
ncbi:MAG TPA: DNA repair protein RecO C-terminal domain-containing protein, partial [Candidatus Saccharimonadales bacterium]|nr:DNA repair protein RecO C-terminal domain-containing protein [Candidatus Saccharimonadales bacterium]